MLSSPVHISEEVRNAIESRRPVVALESALITHGLPQPTNLECARTLEAAVRDEAAVPATIAVFDGVIYAGLAANQIERLAGNDNATKLSVRHLGIAQFARLTGGTTVAATVWAAHRAGILFMATGGIGGVHRDAPADISADLPVLASTPMLVVCSGAKAILDLNATREWLETHGVPLIGYRTDEMPAFYSAASGLPADIRAESPQEVAALVAAHRSVGLTTAMMVGNPPPEGSELPKIAIDSAIAQSLKELSERGVRGSKVTPYLLRRVGELTGGESVQTNIALLENNARLAAQIARAYAALGD